jgi:hypothetical protein
VHPKSKPSWAPYTLGQTADLATGNKSTKDEYTRLRVIAPIALFTFFTPLSSPIFPSLCQQIASSPWLNPLRHIFLSVQFSGTGIHSISSNLLSARAQIIFSRENRTLSLGAEVRAVIAHSAQFCIRAYLDLNWRRFRSPPLGSTFSAEKTNSARPPLEFPPRKRRFTSPCRLTKSLKRAAERRQEIKQAYFRTGIVRNRRERLAWGCLGVCRLSSGNLWSVMQNSMMES